MFIILGLDPGATKSYAILDLRGELIKLKSSRTLDLNKTIKEVFKIGKPLIVSCDVIPAPSFIEKFSSFTGAKKNIPNKNLLIKDKISIAKGYLRNSKYKIKNKHQRDALIAAIIAYKKYRSLFDKIDERLNKINRLDLSEKIKCLVLTKNIPITKAINSLK